MNVIINNRQGRGAGIRCSCEQSQAGIRGGNLDKSVVQLSAVCRFVLPAVLCLLFLCQDFFGPASVFGANYQVIPFTQITMKEDGHPFHFSSGVFYDSRADETYVLADNLVTIYSSNDFFPLMTFGPGRGIFNPASGFIDAEKGLVYICQSGIGNKPGWISVFNGALIPIRQIYFHNIPGIPDFSPTHMVVSHDGLLYVVGRYRRGVAVLDSDGVFLRWLRPTDKVFLSAKQKAAMKRKGVPMKMVGISGDTDSAGASEEQAAKENAAGASAGQAAEKKTDVDIPAQFRPRTQKEKEAEGGFCIIPVRIESIAIDHSGRLYVQSDETSKTYVYNPDETFLFSFGRKGGGPRMVSTPRGVVVDDKRHLVYVLDYMRDSILVYRQKDGEFLFEFGGKGTGPGWFEFPNSITLNKEGQVIVSDLFNHRVQVLTVKYQPESTLGEEEKKASSSSGGGGDEDKAATGNAQAKPAGDPAEGK